MAIIAELNSAWNELNENQALFEFRATAQNCKHVVDETVSKMAEIAAGDDFSGVAVELKQEGNAIKTAIETLQTFFNAHSDFIDWSQPG